MRKFTFLLAILLALPGLALADTSSGVFYQWTDAAGVLSATDDREAVPEAYLDSVQVRTWEEVRANTQEQITPAGTKGQVYFSHPFPVPRETQPNCSGTMTVRRIRIQEGDRNIPVYLIINGCGQVISQTRTNPDVQLIRP